MSEQDERAELPKFEATFADQRRCILWTAAAFPDELGDETDGLGYEWSAADIRQATLADLRAVLEALTPEQRERVVGNDFARETIERLTRERDEFAANARALDLRLARVLGEQHADCDHMFEAAGLAASNIELTSERDSWKSRAEAAETELALLRSSYTRDAAAQLVRLRERAEAAEAEVERLRREVETLEFRIAGNKRGTVETVQMLEERAKQAEAERDSWQEHCNSETRRACAALERAEALEAAIREHLCMVSEDGTGDPAYRVQAAGERISYLYGLLREHERCAECGRHPAEHGSECHGIMESRIRQAEAERDEQRALRAEACQEWRRDVERAKQAEAERDAARVALESMQSVVTSRNERIGKLEAVVEAARIVDAERTPSPGFNYHVIAAHMKALRDRLRALDALTPAPAAEPKRCEICHGTGRYNVIGLHYGEPCPDCAPAAELHPAEPEAQAQCPRCRNSRTVYDGGVRDGLELDLFRDRIYAPCPDCRSAEFAEWRERYNESVRSRRTDSEAAHPACLRAVAEALKVAIQCVDGPAKYLGTRTREKLLDRAAQLRQSQQDDEPDK